MSGELVRRALRPSFKVEPAFRHAPQINFRSGEVASGLFSALRGAMAEKQSLRLLCLAGFRQSERGFREKTGALRKALRGRAELVCLSGPHLVADAAGPESVGPDSGETIALPRKCTPSLIVPRPHNTFQLLPPLYFQFILPTIPLLSAHTLNFLHPRLPPRSPFPLHTNLFPRLFPPVSLSRLCLSAVPKPTLSLFLSPWIPSFPNLIFPIISP